MLVGTMLVGRLGVCILLYVDCYVSCEIMYVRCAFPVSVEGPTEVVVWLASG